MPDTVSLPTLAVLDSHMAYRQRGASGPKVLLLHGNPTSSYLWRDVIKPLEKTTRCIAPDLIGMGQSGKPDIAYRFNDHVRYLDAFIAAMGIESAYLVAQDWGSALALHLAARRPDFVRGMALMEFLRPIPTWEEFIRGNPKREIFRQFRTPGVGEQMIMDDNIFVEKVLPAGMEKTLSEEEMAIYRAPFPTRQSRLPLWRFPNDLPIAGEPEDVYRLMTEAHEALAASTYPKLIFAGDPGAQVSPDFAREFSGGLTNSRLVLLGSGRHFLQEDHGERIGQDIASFIAENEAA